MALIIGRTESFNRNALGHPDYGWGWYNMTDHHLYGDSIYIVNIPNVGAKKLIVTEKKSIDNMYIFKHADLNGGKEEMVELDVSQYETKRFIYYSLENNEAVDREPAADSWDLQFTRYYAEITDNEGNVVNYPVTGVTSNVDIGTNNFHPVAADYTDWNAEPFDSTKTNIGHDWKSFDFSTGWQVADSNVYFVQNYAGDVYKLVFTWWDGSTTGDFALMKQLVSLVNVDEFAKEEDPFMVYPNPSSGQFTLKGIADISDDAKVTIYDQAGRSVYQVSATAAQLEGGLLINNLNLTDGLYIVSVTSENFISNQKLLIR